MENFGCQIFKILKKNGKFRMTFIKTINVFIKLILSFILVFPFYQEDQILPKNQF